MWIFVSVLNSVTYWLLIVILWNKMNSYSFQDLALLLSEMWHAVRSQYSKALKGYCLLTGKWDEMRDSHLSKQTNKHLSIMQYYEMLYSTKHNKILFCSCIYYVCLFSLLLLRLYILNGIKTDATVNSLFIL